MRSSFGKHRTAGGTLLETIVAIVIASAAIVAAAQTVALTAMQQRLAEQQTLATEQAANTMERLYAMPWQELTQEQADQLQLAPGCQQLLPNAELSVTIETAGDSPPAKRMRVEVGWQTNLDGARRSVDLTAWKYQTAEDEP